MRVALYVRRSTIDLQPDSLAAQEERLRSHAAASGQEVVRIYSDSASGKRVEKRDGFQRLIDDVKRGPAFGAVLVRDVSRWSRAENSDEAGYYEFICRTNGVQVLHADESFGPEQSPCAPAEVREARHRGRVQHRESPGRSLVACASRSPRPLADLVRPIRSEARPR